MNRTKFGWNVALVAFSWAVAGAGSGPQVSAQMVNIETPFTSSSDSSFENFGVNFGFSFPGGRGNGSRVVGLGPQGQLLPRIGFQQNNQVMPPFGGFNPGAGATFGFQRVGSGPNFGLGFNLAQGSQRSNVTTAPSVTVFNGASGFISNAARRPFVTGVIPTVGRPSFRSQLESALPSNKLGRPTHVERPLPAPNYSAGRVNSSAAQSSSSLAQIKREREARLAAEAREFESRIAAGDQLNRDGKPVEARSKYRSASRLAKDEAQKKLIKQRIDATRKQ